ncbi:MAG: hypothetical protein GYA45_05930 [Pelolinea sp.]|jgi:hypothetical protein|nr:hypothetical protein [Pelolinea sp.]
MNISPNEAEESLEAIRKITQKTRRSISGSGAYIFLIITGIIWLVGFVATQFLTGKILVAIWVGMSVLGSVIAVLLGTQNSKRVRSSSTSVYVKRILIFWISLIFFCLAAIAIAQPVNGKQITMFIILFTMLGQFAMEMVLSFSSSWWAVPIAALALVGYLFFPNIFYLWMGVLVGGCMIALGLSIRFRW